ncbi:hypothetical protein V1478_001998 [Vespula squamosa]|uniref:Uncharacterized protein n=1 Tax=Vespula squamosa TaxID=30214 RepID=A0ABD2BYQ2_VESSQ
MESTGLQKAEAIITDSYIHPEIGESLCAIRNGTRPTLPIVSTFYLYTRRGHDTANEQTHGSLGQ